jgi:hypothetical protein
MEKLEQSRVEPVLLRIVTIDVVTNSEERGTIYPTFSLPSSSLLYGRSLFFFFFEPIYGRSRPTMASLSDPHY